MEQKIATIEVYDNGSVDVKLHFANNFDEESSEKTGSVYATMFDETCAAYDKGNHLCNIMFLKYTEQYLTDMLRMRGRLYLNDAYDALGINRTDIGQIVGWIYDEKIPIGDNKVDFGLNYELMAQTSNVGQIAFPIPIDFNVDGVICGLG